MDDLFRTNENTHEPLASRMRPRSLDEYIGQNHIVGKGRLLRRAIQADQLTSVIFYGPPGTGKTTLARVIANHTSSNFITLNAVLTGVANIRESIKEAEDQKNLYGKKTILFVDEVHRWNKSQQDALLPWVENGTIILIGATTENPFFEVNKALVSRSRVFQLKALEKEDLQKAAMQALNDRDRGYGKWKVTFEDGALEHLVETANGDCRSLLNALELAVETTPDNWPPMAGSEIYISKEACEESIQKKVVLYDRDGDYHYDIISAFIKSLRGRDPDAACYWLARMVRAGEDPHFIFRRMLISSCEDTGLADPNAISVVESCAAAFDRVGFPEGNYFLAHAALYLATAPKSNSSMAFFDAMSSVEKEDVEVPNHLRDNNRDAEGFGHGKGYLYPHAYRDHWVAQQYLPDSLTGRVFYTPTDQGYEGKIREGVLSRREAQISAILENADGTEGLAANPVSDWWSKLSHFAGFEKTEENLTFSPEDKSRSAALNRAENAWKARTELNRAEILLQTRDAMIKNAELLRHHRCLILNADDGLLVFEATRKTPEGHVYGICRSEKGRDTLVQYSSTLEDLDKPDYAVQEDGSIWKNDNLMKTLEKFTDFEADRFFARNIFAEKKDMENTAEIFRRLFEKKLLSKNSRIILSQIIPCGGQHMSRLVEESSFARSVMTDEDLMIVEKLEKAEKEFFCDSENPLFNWNENTIEEYFNSNDFSCSVLPFIQVERRKISKAELDRWFDTKNSAYGKFMAEKIGHESLMRFKELFERTAQKQNFNWKVKNSIVVIGEK